MLDPPGTVVTASELSNMDAGNNEGLWGKIVPFLPLSHLSSPDI